MASNGSLFTSSPGTQTTNQTPPQETFEGSKIFFPLPTTSPSRFRLSPSENSSEVWGTSLPSRSLQNSQLPDWGRENPFSKAAEASQTVNDADFYTQNITQALQRTTLSGVERSANNGPAQSLALFAPLPHLPVLPPLPPIPRLPPLPSFSQAPRRFLTEVERVADCLHQRSTYDIFNNRSLLQQPIARQECSSSFSPQKTCLSATPTRHLIINFPPSIELIALKQFLNDIGDLRAFDSRKSTHEEVCIASFFDIRHAVTAHKRLRLEQSCGVQYCTNASIAGQPMELEGQVLCQVSASGPTVNAANIGTRLYPLMAEYGQISSFSMLDDTHQPMFLVCFFDTRTADQVVAQLDGQYVENFFIRVSLHSASPKAQSDENLHEHKYLPDRTNSSPKSLNCPTDMLVRRGSTGSLQRCSTGYSPNYSPLHSNHFEPGYKHYLPDPHPEFTRSQGTFPTPQSRIPRGASDPQLGRWESDMDEYNEMMSMRTRDPRILRGTYHRPANWTMDCIGPRRPDSYHPVLNKNTVDLERISQGLDTRTTIMLRNIPNKVDQQTLKDYVDSTSRGKYNFLYLRIDFKNMCNVGYAFINFIDPLDIIPFVLAKSGRRWNKYNSDKVLDVTYANIQGIDQLVEKFRNSSVMDQPEAYRPKLFFSTGPMAGSEMPFPESNNPNRKLRSITAAQHIGLFAPKVNNGKVWRKRD
ncbi:RNA recognition motif 2-domain-containing protein [Kalaharituber pfeilii]|nr:RNA recognition motif 2-domain-containing protein [Kalaharituber pfeilii]